MRVPALSFLSALNGKRSRETRSGTRRLARLEARDGWLLILPILVLLLVFILYPVITNFYYSFTRWKGIGQPKWIGIANYLRMIQDERFYHSLKNIGILILYIPVGVLLPLVLSAIMRDGIKGWKIYRAILYLPSILGPVLLGALFVTVLSQVGPVIAILEKLGVPDAARIHILGKSRSAINTLAFLFVVLMKIGFGCIYFLAAMSGIDPSLYDAAKMDGAGWWSTLFNVTIPSIRFGLQFFTVLHFIEIFARMYGIIFTLTGGGPGFATYTLEFGVYTISFQAFQRGYASSWAVVLFVCCAVIALVQVRLIRKGEG
jgi:ABC-type sugar transport system permease subunit